MNRIVFLLITITLLISTGCGGNFFESIENKNSSEAKEIDISKKLDSGDPDAYLEILNSGDANALDYAAAAMGLAGLDPVNLIDKLQDVSDGDVSTIIEDIEIDPQAFDYLQEAKKKLDEELENDPDNPELNLQMVATSITSTLTVIAKIGDENEVDLKDGIDDSEAESIGNNLGNYTEMYDVTGDGVDDSAAVIIANDMTNIVEHIDNTNLGEDSELNTAIKDIATKPGGLNYTCNTDETGKCETDDPVTEEDITNYLTVGYGDNQ